jgi:3-oxoacyl-[acyl-carrier protein] reductase
VLLEQKSAVIYGAGGAIDGAGGEIGGAEARTFAREAAHVFLAGRTLASLEAVADEIAAAGGVAETAQLDALDEEAVEKHAGEIVARSGRIDVSFNLVSVPHLEGTPLVDLAIEDFTLPIASYARTHLLTAPSRSHRLSGR